MMLNSCMDYIVIFVLFLSTVSSKASAGKSSDALFIFGDSSVDAGNNNYIIPQNRANLKPYGQNGFFHGPTGRFSDGRIVVDFIAEYAKLPLIPPFLQPSADYSHGANFASGGAVVIPETNQGTAIDLPAQLKFFEDVQKWLANKLGEEEAKQIIKEAVYFISIGSNDYMESYLGNPQRQEKYDPETFVGMVIGNLTNAILALYEKGARKFALPSLCPLGCLPAMRALNPKASEGGCFEAASSLALAHNDALRAILSNIVSSLKGFKFSYPNFYNLLKDRINNPFKYGFKDGVNACCGSGAYGGIYSCGVGKIGTEFQLCDNADEHIWWDGYHPTERIHEQFAKAIWNGSPACGVGSHRLEDLLFHKKKR